MKKLLTLAVLALLVFTSCEKGPKGEPGNANVIGTNKFLVLPTDWHLASSGLYTTIDAPEITADVANYGLVVMYMELGTNTWSALPLTIGNITYTYSFYTGYIDIDVVGTSVINNSLGFRFVVVPSSVRKANPNLDWNNYEAVKKLAEKDASVKISDVKAVRKD